ncbi:MAG: sulfatase-like hydrolase/transferase, partial [Candidatus Altiarchaeota archaeon]
MRGYVLAVIFLVMVASALILSIIGTVPEETDTVSRLSSSCRGCNVILVSIDTLRADHLGVYGYGRNTSPAIDSFSGKALVFENVIAQAPWTLPSHISMLTGLYSTRHGVASMGNVLPNSTLTLADILHDAGYATAAFTDGGYVSKRFNYHTFDVFDDSGDHKGRNYEGMLDW